MSLAPGSRVGAYEILSLLGEGGMGQVFRARDTKLARDVAIKVLPDAVAADPERIARFEREARTLAAINEPHIAHVYGFEHANPSGASGQGVHALVMELVEGPTLADRIARGPIPSDEVLPIARQIAEALEAAHDQGIIHRDLKPSNIKVRDDGTVKVLDFGLAKALDPTAEREASAGGASLAPTITTPARAGMLTGVGTILGTAAYMSPEQARGRPVDKRTDVWAFGAVLYEMLCGRRAFDGNDATDVIAAIVRAEPDWNALPRDVSPALRGVVARCLNKDRAARLPSMSVVRFLIEDGSAGMPSAVGVPAHRTRTLSAVGVAAALAGAAAAWFVSSTMRERAVAPRPAHFALVMPPEMPIAIANPDRSIVIAPDGAHIVSLNGPPGAGGGQLMVRSLDEVEPRSIKGVTLVRAPFVSPDSRWIGYFDNGELRKVPMTGGPPSTICRVVGGSRGSAWGPDNTIVFATNDLATGLAIVPADGGEPKVLTKPDTAHGEVDHIFPSFLPGGRVVLFTIATSGSMDNASIAALDLVTGERKTLLRGGAFAEYVPSGHLLYASGGSLRAVRFDPRRLEVLSDPVVAVDQVRTESSGAAQYSVAQTGTLVYVAGGGGDDEKRSLVWVDRHGQEQPINAPARAYLHPRVSPDGSRVAVAIADQEQDIWMLDLARQTLTPLTFGPAIDQYPVWTPDGRRVLFRSDRAGIPKVFWQFADGTGAVEQLTNGVGQLVVPNVVTADGKTLILQAGSHISVMQLGDQQKVTQIVDAPGIQANAALSPDGRYLAYNSSESGQPQVFVRPFPNVDGGRWQVSTVTGTKPAWAASGQELFYISSTGAVMAVPVHTAGSFSFGAATKLFEGRSYYRTGPARTYDVSADARGFLMIKLPTGDDSKASQANATLVLNWTEELKARVPVTSPR